jgi:desulfoferrodoxin (superoxide reductase-like protein)
LKDQNIQALRAKQKKHIPVVLSKDEVRVEIKKVKELNQIDLNNGYGEVYIPFALETYEISLS